MKKRVATFVLAVLMILTIVGCRKVNIQNPSTGSNSADYTDTQANDSENGQITYLSNLNIQGASKFTGGTVMELKKHYDVDDTMSIKPFYNVEQNTEFTFHFNSYVNPFTAVTVHTDPSVSMDSMVYQVNIGYATGSGMDVVVKPYDPVLNAEERKDGKLEYGNWGYAPIYYLSINYDFYSVTPLKLEQPLVIPFTIKNSISTPNVTGNIKEDGTFELTWNQVENATKYIVYEEFSSHRNEDERTRQQLGYVGDQPTVLVELSSANTSFTDFGLDGTDNIVSYSLDDVSFQNYHALNTYYVTAVNSEGEESAFSFPVESWRYADRMPYIVEKTEVFPYNDELYVTKLPEAINVKMVDGESKQFPVDYKLISEEYGAATYLYEVKGTKLKGNINVKFESGEYPEQVISSFERRQDFITPDITVDVIPNILTATISGDNYNNTNIQLGTKTEHSQAGLIGYTQEMSYVRADIEAARLYTDGEYSNSNPFTILYDNPTFIGYNDMEGNRLAIEDVLGTYRDVTTDGGSGNGNTITSIIIGDEVIYDKGSATETKVSATDDSTISPDDYMNHRVPEVITDDNLVEEQIISTQEQIAEGNEINVSSINYPIFADSAEEDYLARALVAAESYIDLSPFPALQNTEYLVDVLMKVSFQNPYIISFSSITYNPETRVLNANYGLSKSEIEDRQIKIAAEAQSIINSIINNSMTTEEKIMAIWSYLESNTNYDYKALKEAEAVEFSNDIIKDNPDAFNTYGILVKKTGVCESYARTTKLLCSLAGVESKVLTGFIDSNLPHAWNAVYIDGWYWVDTTNNLTNMGLPFFIYQTSSDYATHNGYSLDEDFELNGKDDYAKNSDISKDYYSEHGLLFNEPEEAINKLAEMYAETHELSVVKCTFSMNMAQEIINYMAYKVYENGVTKDEIAKISFGMYNGLMFISPDQ